MPNANLWSHPAPGTPAEADRRAEHLGRGRVLRVKDGYNPNSSSVGSAIPGFLVFAAASGALTVLLLNMRTSVSRLLRLKRDAQAHQQPPPPAERPAAEAQAAGEAPRHED